MLIKIEQLPFLIKLSAKNMGKLIIVFLILIIGCDQEMSSLTTSDIKTKKIKVLQDFGTDGAKKAAKHIKQTGHDVCCKVMGYIEDGEFKYYRTVGDRRRKGLKVHQDDPDEMELCYQVYDCETGENIKGACLTVHEFETLGRLK